jgi:putative iron-dependent peroxidase
MAKITRLPTAATGCQPGILAPNESVACYMRFDIASDGDFKNALEAVTDLEINDRIVVGLGPSLTMAPGVEVPLLRAFPHWVAPGIDVASTQSALWICLRGHDRGELLHESRRTSEDLSDEFDMVDLVEGFTFTDGRDLSGYIDGTENPEGEKAIEAAVSAEAGPLQGSSFVAVQQWVHDLDEFESFSQEERDHIIGRRLEDNEEIDDAPEFAHVKRTAQESFDPEAFLLRRSMPWIDSEEHGLMFVAFGKSLDAYEAQLRRMLGLDDGIVDGLLRFSRPITGGYYWCPPIDGTSLVIRTGD